MTDVSRRTKLLLIAMISLFIICIRSFSSISSRMSDFGTNIWKDGTDAMPVVLIWERPFPPGQTSPDQGVRCGCRYTYDRQEAPISDAIVVYCTTADKDNLPPDFPNRKSSQLYIWWCREPPTHVIKYGINLGYRKGFFNWTMTYRRDADVSTPWDLTENMKSFHKKKNMSLQEIMSMKTKTAIAIVGNCGIKKKSWQSSAKKRLLFIKEMQELMPLDGFGRCFQNKISNKKYSKTIYSYKFYLSFENSYHCKDYISEKFWVRPMRHGLVPVAWGASAEDYVAVAPTNSYILVENFNSTVDLVQYLMYLDKNDTAYLEYLRWRSPENLSNVTFAELDPPLYLDFKNMCVLCRRLLQRKQERDVSTSVVDSIKKVYIDSNDEECFAE